MVTDKRYTNIYYVIISLLILLNSCTSKYLTPYPLIGPIYPHPKESETNRKIMGKVMQEGTSYIDYSDTTKLTKKIDSLALEKVKDYFICIDSIAEIRERTIRESPFNNCIIYYLYDEERSVLFVNYTVDNSSFLLREGDIDIFNRVASLTQTSIKDKEKVMDYIKIFLLSVGYIPNKDIILFRDMKDWDDFVEPYKKRQKRKKAVYWNKRWSVEKYYWEINKQWEDEGFVKRYARRLENRLIQGPVHYRDALILEGCGDMKKRLPIYIAEDIKPPEVKATERGYRVELYCWTEEGGNFDHWIINIQRDGQIDYKRERLATEVGPFIPTK